MVQKIYCLVWVAAFLCPFKLVKGHAPSFRNSEPEQRNEGISSSVEFSQQSSNPNKERRTQVTIFDATFSVLDAADGILQHQISLPGADDLVFEWNDPSSQTGYLDCRLVHRTKVTTKAPSWLLVGFYENLENPSPVTNQNFMLDGSNAVIGALFTNPFVQRYTMGNDFTTINSVTPLLQEDQTLDSASFSQIIDQGTEEILTTLSFRKRLDDSPTILIPGENIFMWATGPPGAQEIGAHQNFGAFRLEFGVEETGGDSTTEIMGVNFVNATADYKVSALKNYDHRVALAEDLAFHWKEPNAESGVLKGQLVHTSQFIDAAPSWLGFGFTERFSGDMDDFLADHTFSIVGSITSGLVQKFSLSLNHAAMGNIELVEALPNGKIVQVHDADTGVVTTTLTFERQIVASGAYEPNVFLQGDNTFIWAIGPPGNIGLAKHRDQGAFFLDFSVTSSNPRFTDSGGGTGGGTAGQAVEANPPPVISGRCSSSVFPNGKSLILTPELTMHWEFKESGPIGIYSLSSISIELHLLGQDWIAFGFSEPGKSAHSQNSVAVVGLPNSDAEPQLKYDISSKRLDEIEPVSDQTLFDSSIQQEPDLTILRFNKALNDGVFEPIIKSTGLNTFSFAIGEGNVLGYHRHRASFQIDLSACYDSNHKYVKSNTAKGALKFHGILATLGWGFMLPCSITIAWFRKLVPSTWIYFHVSFNLLTFVFTLISVLVAVIAVGARSDSQHLSRGHHWFGVLLLLGITFQVVNGFLRPPVERKDDGTPVRRESWTCSAPESPRDAWHMLHRGLGISMLLIGLIEIRTGMGLFDEVFGSGTKNIVFLWVYLTIFFLCVLGIKVWAHVKYKKKGERGWFEDAASSNVVGISRHRTPEDDAPGVEIPPRLPIERGPGSSSDIFAGDKVETVDIT